MGNLAFLALLPASWRSPAMHCQPQLQKLYAALCQMNSPREYRKISQKTLVRVQGSWQDCPKAFCKRKTEVLDLFVNLSFFALEPFVTLTKAFTFLLGECSVLKRPWITSVNLPGKNNPQMAIKDHVVPLRSGDAAENELSFPLSYASLMQSLSCVQPHPA